MFESGSTFRHRATSVALWVLVNNANKRIQQQPPKPPTNQPAATHLENPQTIYDVCNLYFIKLVGACSTTNTRSTSSSSLPVDIVSVCARITTPARYRSSNQNSAANATRLLLPRVARHIGMCACLCVRAASRALHNMPPLVRFAAKQCHPVSAVQALPTVVYTVLVPECLANIPDACLLFSSPHFCRRIIRNATCDPISLLAQCNQQSDRASRRFRVCFVRLVSHVFSGGA